MAYSINTHDSWGVVNVGSFDTLELAQQAFRDLCADPWYRQDGTVKGAELLDTSNPSAPQRLDWCSFL
jgi:hypothetical protein